MGKLAKFSIVGGLGFAIDAGFTLMLCAYFAPELARLPAFLLASFVTYICNRNWSFQSQDTNFLQSYTTYFLSSLFGAFLNYVVFLTFVVLVGRSNSEVMVAIALGAAIAMCFNYYISANYIFQNVSGQSKTNSNSQ